MQSVHVPGIILYMKVANKSQNNITEVIEEIDQDSVLNISQARPMLSSIISNAPNHAYLVGKRGVPSIVIMDYLLAKRFVPESFMYRGLSPKSKVKAGKRFINFVEDLHNRGVLKAGRHSKKNAYLAQNVDRIVYGI